MANTYTQINIHGVFAVHDKENYLPKNIRPRIFEYISGICRNNKIYPLAVNGYTDHVHVFFELPPAISVSKALELIKANSSAWINKNKLMPGHFNWQRGFGGFSYSRSQRDQVINYIINQEEHHRKKTLREEYLELLNMFGIDFDSMYLFEFYD